MSQENNFIPNQKPYCNLRPFPLFMKNNFPFIENTYESLDIYGLLCKVVEYLNNVIENENIVTENQQALYDAFVELNDYVSHYFDNLDVQEEINNKLDDMVEDGTLQEIISQFLSSTALWCFDNVNDMKNSSNLINGSYAKTLGFYSKNDGGGATYYIKTLENEIVNNVDIISISENIIAILVKEKVANALQYGIKNNFEENNIINETILFTNKNIIFPAGNYLLHTNEISHDINITGIENCVIKPVRKNVLNNRYNTLFTSDTNDLDILIENINFIGYSDINTDEQSGTKEILNSLFEINNANKLIIKNCSFDNFDNRWAPEQPSTFISRYAALFTIHDTKNTEFLNCTFENIRGEEEIYIMNNELDRENINANFYNNKFINIHTTTMTFIGNKLILNKNYYNFIYTGSMVNGFALDLYVDNETIYGSYDNCYDNSEENYFTGEIATIKNVNNYAAVSNTILGLNAKYCIVDSIINHNINNVLTIFRNYFNGGIHDNHKDTSTSPTYFTQSIIKNSQLISQKPIQSIFGNITPLPDYNLTLDNCVIKSTLDSNTQLIYSLPMKLLIENSTIYNCTTAGSSAPAALYSRPSPENFTLVTAINNRIINKSSSAERFYIGSAPNQIMFENNINSTPNNIISPDLSYVKAFGNYNYIEQ